MWSKGSDIYKGTNTIKKEKQEIHTFGVKIEIHKFHDLFTKLLPNNKTN